MKDIFILVDYKNRFETKYTAEPYRSGFDKHILTQYFKECGINANFLSFPEINFADKRLNNRIFLYTSSEDKEGFYKSYIEDIILGLSLAGAIVIPEFKYLKAHNNKLFMEILRDLCGHESLKNIHSHHYGTIEDLVRNKNLYKDKKVVIKPAMGAMSKGVTSASSFKEISCNSKIISKSLSFLSDIKDWLRKYKHKGYIPDSRYRKKFVIQNMVESLDGDWKILIYGNKYFPLKRENRKNDFRASGGGRLSYTKELPEGLLSFAKKVCDSFETPNISIDVGFNGSDFYLIEFQALYFGTFTIENADYYFKYQEPDCWGLIEERCILEKEYARSISNFLKRKVFN